MTKDEFDMLNTSQEKLDILFSMISQNVKTQSTIIDSLALILRSLKSVEEGEKPSNAPETILTDILARVESIETMLRKQA